MIHYYEKIDSLKDFKKRNDQLGILERNVPSGANSFFKKINQISFSISGKVVKSKAKDDIHALIKDELPKKILYEAFYQDWLIDMSNICKTFCTMQAEKSISFWLGSERGCKRYHVDMVPFRLLVTYAGKGTELLPDHAANRDAFMTGKSNKYIVKDVNAIRYMNKWDISIFRGGYEGILHRTPDSALDGSSSILMRLDNKSFLENIEKINGLS